MKKFLFLMLSAAVAVSASAGINGAKISKKVAKIEGKSKTEQVARVAKSGVVATPAPKFRAPAKVDIPAGMVAVTLTAGDVWGDGSGYQMLLDADTTAFGTIIPETGPLTSEGDASAETYAEFEYKIPENADGAMTTQNIVMNNSITIVIPAGIYDWCITNPTPEAKIWIASANGIGGRADNFEFLEGYTYEFTLALDSASQNDITTLRILDPNGNEVVAPATPELTVNPAATSATVTWAADENATGWNLIWRPFVDTSGNPIDCDLNGTSDEINAEANEWAIIDNDGDGNNWGVIQVTEGDGCFYSRSYASGTILYPDNWLISPELKLQGVLEFNVFDYGYAETMRPYVITEDMTTLDEAIPLGDEDIVTNASQLEKVSYSFDLNDERFAGKMGMIAFRHYNCSDGNYLFVDDIFIGDHNATIVEPYEWTLVQGLTTPEYTIEGLAPETTYEVAVQGYNQFFASEVGYTTFVTLAEQAGKLGDVNKDGFVKIDDVTALIDALLGGNALEETATYSPDNANVNGDETVNIADVTALIDMLLSGAAK